VPCYKSRCTFIVHYRVLCRLTWESRALLQNFGSSAVHKVEFRENIAMVGQKGLTRGTAIEQVVCTSDSFDLISFFKTR